MILDVLSNAAQYANAHPLFAKAFEFLQNQPLATLPTGRHEIQGDDCYANIMEPECGGHAAAKIETHFNYIDIQFVVSGNEEIGWSPLCGMGHKEVEDRNEDYALWKDAPMAWFPVRPGSFAIFFPGDGHAPCAGTGKCRKVVVKVRV